ncbi:hypothetical protein [Niallia oryzisoli]|uniref:hypothetical protein n=1 Tax=Niallia oryzisoli TaxID=1737571 RepID=UPI0037370C68
MDVVLKREISQLLNQYEKNNEIEKIKKAMLAGDLNGAKVLYHYSDNVTSKEFEEIKSSLNLMAGTKLKHIISSCEELIKPSNNP